VSGIDLPHGFLAGIFNQATRPDLKAILSLDREAFQIKISTGISIRRFIEYF